MIQISDISELSALRGQLTQTVMAQSSNWNDEVFSSLESQYIAPIMTRMDTAIADASSCIRMIVSIYNQMESLASGY